MAHVFALICATSTPGTIRNKSGIFVAPERRMSSCVITKTAEAMRESFCSVFDTDVTWTFIKSSRLESARSAGLCCGQAGRVERVQAAMQSAIFDISTECFLTRLIKE